MIDSLFIVGCGRSGTTLVYEHIIESLDSYFVTNVEDHFPSLGLLAPIAHSRIGELSSSVIACEGYGLWSHWLPNAVDEDDPRYDEVLRDHSLHDTVRSDVSQRLRRTGNTLFLNKNTRNSTRVELLATLFPNARFVHVVRNPLAVVHSLLNVNFWPEMPVWQKGGKTVSEIAPTREDEVRLASEIWVRETTSVHQALDQLPAELTLRFAYEDYLEDPAKHLLSIGEHVTRPVSLPEDFGVRKGTNRKYKSGLSESDIEIVLSVTGDTARQYGYDIAA